MSTSASCITSAIGSIGQKHALEERSNMRRMDARGYCYLAGALKQGNRQGAIAAIPRQSSDSLI